MCLRPCLNIGSFCTLCIVWQTVWNRVILNGDLESRKSAFWDVIMLESKHLWLFGYFVVLFHIPVCAAVLAETKSSDLSDVPSLKKQLKATGFKLFETVALWVLAKGWSIIATGHLLSVFLSFGGKNRSALLHIHAAQKGLFFFSSRSTDLYFRTCKFFG